MDVREEIINCISESDLVLVDACIFGCTDPSGSHREISEHLYDAKKISQLENLTEEVFALHMAWRWDLHCIVSKDNVYTIPGVVEEINGFSRILQNSYSWHTELIRNPKRKGKPSKNMGDPREEFPALDYLDSLIKDVGRTINRLNIYRGPKVELFRNVEGASETDYNLVEAAVGYSLSHPEMKVEILSEDRHVHKIINNYLKNKIARTINETQTDLETITGISQS